MIFNDNNGLNNIKQLLLAHARFNQLTLETIEYYITHELNLLNMNVLCKDVNALYVNYTLSQLKNVIKNMMRYFWLIVILIQFTDLS